MSGENIHQVYVANPITSNASTDLMYFGQSPYGAGNDAAMLFSSFVAQFVQKDGNGNITANNFLEGYTTTATAAAITTLTVASTYQQYFTGSTSQTVKLPVTSTLALGQSFYIVNNSTGTVTVESSGANTIQAMAANTSLLVTCILTSGTTAASWNAEYAQQSSINLYATETGTNASFYPALFATFETGAQPVYLSSTITYNPSGGSELLTVPNLASALAACTGLPISSGVSGLGTGVATALAVNVGSPGAFVVNGGAGSLVWNDVSGTSQAAAVNNGYICSNASQTTVTLPATAAEGSVVAVQGKGAAGFIVAANTSQVIHFGSSASSSAGSLTSTNQYDSVSLVCITANTLWAVTAAIGNITVA